MEGCVEGSLITIGNISATRGLEPETAISAGQASAQLRIYRDSWNSQESNV